MKRCPYCDEEVRDNAVKCKHCGERLPAVWRALRWSIRSEAWRIRQAAVGQNRRVPVFGALDAMTGEVTAKKRSGEFLEFLQWVLEDIYGSSLFLTEGG